MQASDLPSPAESAVEYLAMNDERVSKIETQQERLEQGFAELRETVKQLTAVIDLLPKPVAYHFVLSVPAGTQKEEVEDQLKAACTFPPLSGWDFWDPCDFCVLLGDGSIKDYPVSLPSNDGRSWASLFRCHNNITPVQARSWANSVADSYEYIKPHVIQFRPEREWFRNALEGTRSWSMCQPLEGQWEWVEGVMQSTADRECDYNMWMNLTYPINCDFGPWIPSIASHH